MVLPRLFAKGRGHAALLLARNQSFSASASASASAATSAARSSRCFLRPASESVLLMSRRTACTPVASASTLTSTPTQNATPTAAPKTTRAPLYRRVFKTFVAEPKRYTLRTLGAVVGGYTTYYATTYMFITIPSYISSFSLVDASKIGFYVGGVCTALGMGALVTVFRRFLLVRPHPLFEETFKRLERDPVVLHRLGGRVRASKFKAYNFEGGLGWSNKRPTYTKPTIQLIFQLHNPHLDDSVGVVSLDVDRFKVLGDYKFNSLAVDLGTGERLLIHGEEKDVPFKGVIRLR